MAKLTTNEFIKKAQGVHGDKYDYSKVEYVNTSTKVCIICKEHGEFWQQPANHLHGIGCPRCGIEKRKAKRTHSIDYFLKSAKAIHGEKYDYSRVKYENSRIKVCIVCPVHGEFWQSPQKHLFGKGCEKCSRESLAKQFSLGKDLFIEKAKAIFNNYYDYSEVDYVNSMIPVKIGCPLHGAFMQNPHNHLSGHGCPICATKEIAEKNRIWTYETCMEEARKYLFRNDFKNANPSAYNVARENGWLDSYEWLKTKIMPKGYWTMEQCEKESRKYQSKTEFMRGCSTAYSIASKNRWIDKFTWLLDKRIDIVRGRIDSVYVYVFEESKTAYIGRTLIRRQKKRDKEHIFNVENDNVARYANKLNVPVPPMRILETNLTLEEGLEREDYWRKWYEQQGYNMLNKLATGIGKGSLGGISHGKWNRKTCYKEALKYKSASEFSKMSASAYSAARLNGWLSEYVWFNVLWETKWNKHTCYNEAKKYRSRGEFQRGSRGAYIKALEKGWISEYTWLSSRQTKPKGYWDNYDHCYEEAKKYKNRRRFQKGCMGAYTKALKNNWLDDYTWFDEKKMDKYWDREKCLEEAKKYSSKTEFKRNANGAYQTAYLKGWLNDYTWFKPLTGFWTYEACKKEASKYLMRSHFKNGSPGAYSKSRINGWLNEFFPIKKLDN